MNQPQSAASRPDDDARRALLSALADGDAQALQPGCELWRDDADARRTWHAYHLIGDVMRSDELALRPGRDAAFLAALRVRLEAEPVVLAPLPEAVVSPIRHARRRQRWMLPGAAAAGFMAVAGVLVAVRMAEAPAGGPTLAAVPVPLGDVRTVAADAAPPRQLVIEGRLIRDARLDAYLEAHRQAYFGPSAAVPGGVPRNIAATAPVLPVQAAAGR